jgi:hypothetical protein
LVDPRDFRKYVTNRGKWDYKLPKGTIYGLGNSDHTKFIFQGKEVESQDLGNYHLGVWAKAKGFFYEKLILVKAGENQMSKPGASKPEWQKYIIHRERVPLKHGGSYNIEYKEWLPPYGDDPRAQCWIIQGFNYFREFNKR